MPVCSIALLDLKAPTPSFLAALKVSSLKPLLTAKVIRWIILPTTTSIDALLSSDTKWDLLLVYPSSNPFPSSLQLMIRKQWIIKAGIPSRLTSNFDETNTRLLHPHPGDIPLLTGSLDESTNITQSAQNLELSHELRSWIRSFSSQPSGGGAVSMLNLLAFKEGMKDSYLQYGAAFAKSIGSQRGGVAKLVGSIVEEPSAATATSSGATGGQGAAKEWDEFAIAHYPSVLHFADMLAGKDYQEVNHRCRVPSLRDTLILCTSELEIEDMGLKESKL